PTSRPGRQERLHRQPHVAVRAVGGLLQPQPRRPQPGRLVREPLHPPEVQVPQSARQRPVRVVHEQRLGRRRADCGTDRESPRHPPAPPAPPPPHPPHAPPPPPRPPRPPPAPPPRPPPPPGPRAPCAPAPPPPRQRRGPRRPPGGPAAVRVRRGRVAVGRIVV